MVNTNAFEFGHQTCLNMFHFDVACGRYCILHFVYINVRFLACYVAILQDHSSWDVHYVHCNLHHMLQLVAAWYMYICL